MICFKIGNRRFMTGRRAQLKMALRAAMFAAGFVGLQMVGVALTR